MSLWHAARLTTPGGPALDELRTAGFRRDFLQCGWLAGGFARFRCGDCGLDRRDVRIHPQMDALLAPIASVLLGVVGLVLAIACSNLATLLLVRGTARTKEVSVRLALGATRGQLVRHLLMESLLLSAA